MSVFLIFGSFYPRRKTIFIKDITFKCQCAHASYGHIAGHIAVKHYLKKSAEIEHIQPEIQPLILSLSGCVGDALLSGDLVIDIESNDYNWALSYINSNKIDCDIVDIISDLKLILVQYPLEKMTKNISSHDKKYLSKSTSLFSGADNKSKIAGAYDDVDLMPFMDR